MRKLTGWWLANWRDGCCYVLLNQFNVIVKSRRQFKSIHRCDNTIVQCTIDY